LLIRRLPPYQRSSGKRLVKSPRVYVRDSGLVHTLLGIDDRDSLLGHPVAGASWEGFVVENILRVVPDRVQASFYRTAAGAIMDLVLEWPGAEVWAIEIATAMRKRTASR
jgi:predicted AAA+ superfamily ATPase